MEKPRVEYWYILEQVLVAFVACALIRSGLLMYSSCGSRRSVLTTSDMEIQGQLLPCFQFHVLREVDLWKHGDGVVDGGCLHVQCDDAPTRCRRTRSGRDRAVSSAVVFRSRLQGHRRRWGLIEIRHLRGSRRNSRRCQRIEAPRRIESPWRSNGWGLQYSTRSNDAACDFGSVDAACYINTMLLRMLLATLAKIRLR